MPYQEIYKFLKDNGLTQKDEATFAKEYSDPKKAQELYKFFADNKLTTKDSATFYNTYFGSSKKKEPTAGGAAPKPSAFSAPVFGPLAQSVSDPKKVLSVPVAPKGQPKTKYTPEQIKNYGGQVLAETQGRLANTGFDPNQSAQLLDDNVLNFVLNEQRDLSAQSFSQRFADLSRFRLASDQQLPKVQLPAGVEAPKQKTFELEAQQVEREFKADVKRRQADLAVMRGVEIAKRNPTESPRVIGTEILKVADPDTYAIWEKTGFANRNIARQAEELGVQALAATGDDNAARLAAEDLSTMDDRFPEQKIAIARQMIAAKAYEDASKVGVLMGKRWTVEEMDKYAQQLPEDYRQVYEQYIKPQEAKMGMFGTNIPNWGLAKFGEGLGSVAEETGKSLQSAMGLRDDRDVANEILNAPTDTRYANVGENAALEARKRELQLKKENKQATAADIYELEELTKTTNARGAAQRFLDGAANVTGNVAAFAVMGRALGNALGAAANRAGIMATEVPLGARGLDAIAETATSFGLRKGVLDTAGLLAAGYAASDNSNAKAALQLFPDDKDTDKRTAYKQVMNWANAASELVFRDTKVLDAFKRTVSPKIVTFVSQLSKGQIDNLAAKETVKSILREGFQVAKATGANINQEAVEELLPVVTDAVATGVLAPDKLDVGDKFKEAWDTYMTMLVDGSVVGLVGGVRDYRQNRVALPFMSKLGRVGFEDFTTAIQTEIARQEVQGELTPEQAQEKRAIIQAFAAANESAATNPALQDKPQREVDKYVALDAKARILAEKVQTVAAVDTAAADILAEQIQETEQAKADLLSDSTVVTEEGGIVPANEAPIEEDLTKISTAESRKAALKEAVRAAFPQTPTNEPTTTEANQPPAEIEGAPNPQQIEAGTTTGVQPSIGGMGQAGAAGNVAVEQPIPRQGDTVTIISKTDGKPINYFYNGNSWVFTDSRGKEQKVTQKEVEAVTQEWETAQGFTRPTEAQQIQQQPEVGQPIPQADTESQIRNFIQQSIAQFPDATSEEIMEAISEDAPQLVATEEQQQAVREIVDEAVLGAGNVFAAIDAANTKRSINARNAAKTQVREKYGEEAAKAMDINSNFDKYIAQLKDTGVIEKVIC